MAFVPKLPSWQITVQVYRNTAGVWANVGEIFGQVYTPLRNQDDESGGLLYFMMPKNQVTPPYKGNPGPFGWLIPRTPYEGVADVIEIPLPGGNGTVAYQVRDVRPRWLGFPNEHILVDLQRLAPSEWNADIHEPPPLPPPSIPQGPSDLEIDGVVNDECGACDELNGTYANLEFKGLLPNNGWPIYYWESPVFSWSCSPTGFAWWRITELNPLIVGGVVTIGASLMYAHPTYGPVVIVEDVETVDPWDGSPIVLTDMPSTNECNFDDATITISFAVEVPPLLPPFWHIINGAHTDGDCTACAEIAGFEIDTDGNGGDPYHFWFTNTSAGLSCSFGAGTYFLIYHDGAGGITLRIAGIQDEVQWTGSVLGWNGTDPITLTSTGANTACVWDSVTLEPIW